MLQKFKSCISHFVQSGFRLLHFSTFFCPPEHLWIPCTSLAKACIESHIISLLGVCMCIYMCFWLWIFFHAVCKTDCAKVTYKSWQHVLLLCMDSRRDEEKGKEMGREIKAWVRVMNPKSHCDCTNECTWLSTQWFKEKERLREQRLDLEWLDIWHKFTLITVYAVFICL